MFTVYSPFKRSVFDKSNTQEQTGYGYSTLGISHYEISTLSQNIHLVFQAYGQSEVRYGHYPDDTSIKSLNVLSL